MFAMWHELGSDSACHGTAYGTSDPIFRTAPPYEQQGGGKRRFIAIMAGLIVAIVLIAAAFLFLSGGLGGDEEGTCHVIYYRDGYREEYKYPHTKSECDQYCVEAADTHYSECYWDDE
ncbi:MAG: hypothetical protein JSV43_01990 [Methanobacteriota archaeon]|nr:MAG: hypothetical protein JSV43_01990 [Euryarchaeota archaeon]